VLRRFSTRSNPTTHHIYHHYLTILPETTTSSSKDLVDDTVNDFVDYEFPLVSDCHVLRIYFGCGKVEWIYPRNIDNFDSPRNKIQEFVRIFLLRYDSHWTFSGCLKFVNRSPSSLSHCLWVFYEDVPTSCVVGTPERRATLYESTSI